jgi:hypothetical protein
MFTKRTKLPEGMKRRIADDIQLIFMGRTLERLYGLDSVDILVEYQNQKSKKNWQQKARESGRQDPSYLRCLFSLDNHEYTIIRDDPNYLEVKVTKCVHAEVFRSYNAADLGEKLICSGDYAVVEGYNPQIKLIRPTTCMTGDTCHFIFKLNSS